MPVAGQFAERGKIGFRNCFWLAFEPLPFGKVIEEQLTGWLHHFKWVL
jgi:hypothetical protein